MTLKDVLDARLRFVIVIMVVLSAVLLLRLLDIQMKTETDPEIAAYFQALEDATYTRIREYRPTRGQVYDRDGEVLAVNTVTYEVGVSPRIVPNPAESARDLAAVLNVDELALYNILLTDEQWYPLARPVSAAVGQAVQDLDITGVLVSPLAGRYYPQGTLAAQIIGFVNAENQGFYGVEGAYQRELAGESQYSEESTIPFEVQPQVTARNGNDLVLTIDRDMQYLIEQELTAAIDSSGAERGTIIVMNPRSGEILGMASYPSFDPNNYAAVIQGEEQVLINPAISEQYEPGSVFKVLTMAVGIEEGLILPSSVRYIDATIECGGVTIANWDRAAHGSLDMTQVMVQSLNVGTSLVTTELGPTRYYRGLQRLGIGQPTLVDLAGEEAGALPIPGDSEWDESMLCTHSFGQGVAVTPLQMLTAVSAIANDGLMMQPHVVAQIIDGERVFTTQPSPLGRPISAETAHLVRDMMVQVVQQGVPDAQVPGYLVAGKTGTAQIPTPAGYTEDESIVTFVGFLPADDPQVSVLIKLDRPDEYWGSIVAAPIFAHLAERLVLLLDIPPDDVRHNLTVPNNSPAETALTQ